MSGTFTITLTISRQADAGDAKGSFAPRNFPLNLPGLTDDEIQFKIPAGAVDLTLTLPSVGTPQLVFIRSDQPISYKRNAETVVNQIGTGGYSLDAGSPASGVALTQLLFSNPGTVPATAYVLIAGV